MRAQIIFLALGLTVFYSASCAKNLNPVIEMKPSFQTTPEADFVSAQDAAKNALRIGDKMPLFELPDSKGGIVKADELLRNANLVLVFYRGEWCPFCNLYLKRLQERNGEIMEHGGRLVAISVENPDESLSVSEKNKLEFTVLSDKNLELARKFKIVYQLPPDTDKKYKKMGIDLVRDNGTTKPELPLSATYIVGRDGKITYAFLDPDYKKRLEADVIIEELKKLKKQGIPTFTSSGSRTSGPEHPTY